MCSAYDDPTTYSDRVALDVQDVLTPTERGHIRERFFRLNPGWRGADVADILASLGDVDANLDVIEPLYAAHGFDVPEVGLLGAAAYAVIWGHDVQEPAIVWTYASEIIERVRARR